MSQEEDTEEDNENSEENEEDMPIISRYKPIVKRNIYPHSDLYDVEAERHLLDEDQLRQQWKAVSYLLDTSTWRYSNISNEYIDIEQKGVPYNQFLNQIEARLKAEDIEFVIQVLLKGFKQEHDFIDNTVMAKITNLFEGLVLTIEKQNVTIKGLLTKYGGMTKMVDEMEINYKGALAVAEDKERENKVLQEEINRLKDMDEHRKGYVKQVMDYAVARMKQAVVEAFKKPDDMVKQVQEIMETAKDDVKKFDIDLSIKAGIDENKETQTDEEHEEENKEEKIKEEENKEEKKKEKVSSDDIDLVGVKI